MLAWPAYFPIALVSSIFACLDIGDHAALRCSDRHLLAVSKLATSSPRAIIFRVTAENATMDCISGYRPHHLSLNFIVPFSAACLVSMAQLVFAPHVASLCVRTGMQDDMSPLHAPPSFMRFAKLTTFIHSGIETPRAVIAAVFHAPSLTHLDVSVLSPHTCLELPLTLQVLRAPIRFCSENDERAAAKWRAYLTGMTKLERLELRTSGTFECAYSLRDLARHMPHLRVLKITSCEAPTEPLRFTSLTELSCGFTRSPTVDDSEIGSNPEDTSSAYHHVLDIVTLETWDFHRDDSDRVNFLAATQLSHAIETRVRPTTLTDLRIRAIHHADLERRLCKTTVLLHTLRFVCNDARNFQCLAQLVSLQHLHIHGCNAVDLEMAHVTPSTISQIWPPLPSLHSLTTYMTLSISNTSKLVAYYPHVDTSRSVPHTFTFRST
jgi:hypothetical protein